MRALFLAIALALVIAVCQVGPRDHECDLLYTHHRWAIKLYERPNCHKRFVDQYDNNSSPGTRRHRERLRTKYKPKCIELKKAARSFKMVARSGCGVTVWRTSNCTGHADYSTNDGSKDTSLGTLFTTVRRWTEDDVGADAKAHIRSYKTVCRDVCDDKKHFGGC
jgi:hypothetical protein